MTTVSKAISVLAIDDEPSILKLMSLELKAQGYDVHTETNPADGLAWAERESPDIVLLDISMPGMNGLEVMGKLRETTSTPIILVTAKDSTGDRIHGLTQGADDYIVKPFSLDELSARIRAVLRRSARSEEAERVVNAGDVAVDLQARRVTKGGQPVSLTRNEWLLLQTLAEHQGKVMLNSELLSKVWGPEYRDDLQYLRVWVSRVRHKLEDDPANPQLIVTAPGIGYKLTGGDKPTV